MVRANVHAAACCGVLLHVLKPSSTKMLVLSDAWTTDDNLLVWQPRFLLSLPAFHCKSELPHPTKTRMNVTNDLKMKCILMRPSLNQKQSVRITLLDIATHLDKSEMGIMWTKDSQICTIDNAFWALLSATEISHVPCLQQHQLHQMDCDIWQGQTYHTINQVSKHLYWLCH